MLNCGLCATFLVLAASAQQPASTTNPAAFARSIEGYIAPAPVSMPLYKGEVPNSIPGPNLERSSERLGETWTDKVSLPTLTVYRAAPKKAGNTAVLVFPGGGYTGLSWTLEGTRTAKALQDHGVTAIIVKYRLPSDATMKDKSIGPLQDAQQAFRVVRRHAQEWNIDPQKIGAIGFSAGGHLVSTLGTHFDKSYIPNIENDNVRPDFLILIYPVISMKAGLTHSGSHDALLGRNAPDDKVALFSNETQVTEQTPPTLLLHASDDLLVDVDNSVAFYQALHHHQVPAQMILFTKGNHGFFEIPTDEWHRAVWTWMKNNGWMKD